MKTTRKSENKFLIPIILMMGLVPVIVYRFQYASGLSQFDWYGANDDQVDYFLVWKMIALVSLGIVMAGILLYRWAKKKQNPCFGNSFYFLLVYAMFAIMSALFSPYRRWAFGGTAELFESVLVLIAYMIAICYVYTFVQEEKQVDRILSFCSIGACIVTVIGVFQSFGLDLFGTDVGKRLILPPGLWDDADSMVNITMAKGTAYTTLYNPNFLSFYFGMLIPLIACLIIGSHKVWQKVVLVAAEVLAAICMWGSRSSSGWMALAIGIGIVILVLLSRTRKTGGIAIALVAAFLVGAIVTVNCTDIGKKLWDTVAGTYHMQDKYGLKDFETLEDGVQLNINDRILKVSCDVDDSFQLVINVSDGDGNPLAVTRVDDVMMTDRLEDPDYLETTVRPLVTDDKIGVCVSVEGIEWNFLKDEDSYYYLNQAGKLVSYQSPKRSELFAEDTMSFRGHIWNDTIPLLGKHVFMGSGANTFLFEYPQNDYIYKAYVYGANTNMIDVKAHNWYLQQWVENGLIGTLALLIFIGIYVVRSASIYRKADLKNRITWLGIGFFAAVLVYLAVAIANDSNVGTAPVFWCVLGLGMAVNRMVVKNDHLLVKESPLSEESLDSNVQTPTGNIAVNEAKPVPAQAKKKKQSRKQRKQNHK